MPTLLTTYGENLEVVGKLGLLGNLRNMKKILKTQVFLMILLVYEKQLF